MKEKMIAFCGACCNECPGFLATQNDDDDARAKTAELWSKMYDCELKVEDINCDGCKKDGGRLLGHCTVCEIRLCGLEKQIENCAHCDDYVCEKLEKFFGMAPDLRKTLDAIRETL